jgi:hypothetical protein
MKRGDNATMLPSPKKCFLVSPLGVSQVSPMDNTDELKFQGEFAIDC